LKTHDRGIHAESYKLTPRTFVGLKCLELVALWKGWIWTFNDLIVERLWPLLGILFFILSTSPTCWRLGFFS
jgi:hypothetical protein